MSTARIAEQRKVIADMIIKSCVHHIQARLLENKIKCIYVNYSYSIPDNLLYTRH